MDAGGRLEDIGDPGPMSGTAILVPSLNRPQHLRRLVENIHAATDEEHAILFCVSDEESKEVLTSLGEWFLDDSDGDDRRYVTRMNKLITYIADAEFIFFGSDDVIHHPGWLRDAQKVLVDPLEVVVVNDLRNQNGTQALIRASYLDRAVFDAPGMAFHDGYLHNFADTEQFYTAQKHGVYGRALGSYVEHLHPIFGHARSIAWDQTYATAMANYEVDQARYEERVQRINEVFG
jgi:hypothetical protein